MYISINYIDKHFGMNILVYILQVSLELSVVNDCYSHVDIDKDTYEESQRSGWLREGSEVGDGVEEAGECEDSKQERRRIQRRVRRDVEKTEDYERDDVFEIIQMAPAWRTIARLI